MNSAISSPTIDRRAFLKTATTATALLAATPASVLAADDRKVTLAFAGCAHIHTPGFVNLLKGRPDVAVKYTWDPNSKRSEHWAKQLNCAVARSQEEIWSDPAINGVVICSETAVHPELVAAAAGARKHLFVEKPLGITARESLAMARTIEGAGLLFTTGYFMRTDPKHLFLKEQIAKGTLGRITRASAWNCHSGSLGGWFDSKPNDLPNDWRWMADPKQAGVGAFGDLGTHSLDILMWLLGGVDSVSADVRVITGRYGPDCDETGLAQIKFKSGVMGTLAAGWVDIANPVTLEISGTEGHAVIFRDKLYFRAKDISDAEPITALPSAPRLPLHQFVDAIAGKAGQPLVKPAEAAARVVVMEAMYRSAKAGKWTKVV